MTALEHIERLTDQIYGKGSAVSVDKLSKGWAVRCWDKTGKERLVTEGGYGIPLSKTLALTAMKRKLQRASFLRLDAEEASDG